MKNVYFVIVSIISMFLIIRSVRKKKFTINESFLWMVASIVMLVLSIFPYSIDYFAKLLDIAYAPSLLFIACIVFLVLMVFRNSKRIAEQNEKILNMAQEIAILKEKNNEKK